MGLNPFKAAKKAVKGITKPFKKVLRSPIGKAALMYATWKFGPKAFGAENLGGAGGWGQAATRLPPWLYEAGAAPVQEPTGVLAKAAGFAKKHPYITAGAAAMGVGALGDDVLEEKKTVIDDSGHKGYLTARKGFVDEWTEWLVDQGHDEVTARAMAEKELFAKAEGGIVGLAQGGRIRMQGGNPHEMTGGNTSTHAGHTNQTYSGGQGIQDAREKYIHAMHQPQKYFVRGALGVDPREKKDYFSRPTVNPNIHQGGGGQGAQPEWQRLGYPSYAAWLAAQQSQGGGGGTGGGIGDYYGFKEWEDWEGGPTTPLFGGTSQYQGLLSQGGRIGLYAGGMGAMSNPMNPMMNQGLGAVGSQGMNPYNQQNLMQQAQMRGRPPMPGGPTTAQGPGITGTQAGAALAKKEDDGELLKLIRMLASMGIPMEQLRGRTKEELVEMVMSLSAKAEAQGGGREEVVEEQEEEVVEAAHGGRIRAAGGLGEIYTPRAKGGLMRTGYAMGTEQPVIPSKDGPQLDFRGVGGYQPHGRQEKKDDVRALLAQGEFVVTSDAVKGIGEGDRDLGAKRMYDMMHKYEPIGRALS